MNQEKLTPNVATEDITPPERPTPEYEALGAELIAILEGLSEAEKKLVGRSFKVEDGEAVITSAGSTVKAEIRSGIRTGTQIELSTEELQEKLAA